jgi:hypothetical protein
MTRTLRITGLSLVALTAFGLIVLPTRGVRSQDDLRGNKPSPVEGAWKQIAQKNGDAPDYQKLPEGTEQLKFVTGGRFVFVIVKAGRIEMAAGGKYTVDKDNKYSESIEYVHGENLASLVGKTASFTWKVDGATSLLVGAIHLDGQDVKIDEKWERCK